MFDNQNKNFNSAKTQDDKIDVSNLPLRTMEKDLKNIGNPNFNASDFMPEDEALLKKEPIESNLSETQKTSPFLSPSQSQIKPITQNYPSKFPVQNENDTIYEEPKTKGIRFDMKKVAILFGAILIVLAGIASAYYFMIYRNSNTKTNPPVSAVPPSTDIPSEIIANPAENTTQNTNTSNTEQTTVVEQEKINSDKPNFLVIDSEAIGKAAIQEIINSKIEDVKAAKIFTPVEFIISDKNFAPSNFQDFSKELGLSLPANITENFKTTFSFFISNDENDQTGIALLIDIKDEKTLKPLLAKEEPQLVKELDPLYLGKSYQTAGVPFSVNNYRNNEIRYHNIQKDASMSLDYVILNSKLMLATSKMTTLSIIDKILLK